MVEKDNRIHYLLIYLLFLAFVICYISGCAPAVKNHIVIPEITIERDETIPVGKKIDKPKKPNPILYDKDLAVTQDPSKIKYFAFTPEEFKKIVQLSQSFDAQGDLIEAYVDLINLKIGINNDLIDLLNNKRDITQYYADLYINENNLRLQEHYIKERERILDKIVIILQTVVLLAIAL